MARTREASHAGSWYSQNGERLSIELDRWLDAVPERPRNIGTASGEDTANELPVTGARAIIAPHAGYSYSGKAAAWAYKALDLKSAKRIFVLGPSHHHYLAGCALSQCNTYATPLGDLALDLDMIVQLQKTGKFDTMSQDVDEAEHSIEMHLPYIHKVLTRTFSDYTTHLPPLVPILVGATSATSEKSYGALLAPFLADPANVFIISSDFCHWGSRFRYTYYEDGAGRASSLRSRDRPPTDPPIHESIARVDLRCIDAIETGSHDAFLQEVETTGNTVCGRHPIGIVLAGLEHMAGAGGSKRFKFVRYERSSECVNVDDSSVSYASAYAVLQ